mgnify:CR=1 FL=1
MLVLGQGVGDVGRVLAVDHQDGCAAAMAMMVVSVAASAPEEFHEFVINLGSIVRVDRYRSDVTTEDGETFSMVQSAVEEYTAVHIGIHIFAGDGIAAKFVIAAVRLTPTRIGRLFYSTVENSGLSLSL